MSDLPANAPPLNQPPHFELAGDHAQITYDTTGISGGPLFNYKDGPHPIQELGTKIPTVDHELGPLVTAMLGVSTLENVRLTLLVPRIELRGPPGNGAVADLLCIARHTFRFTFRSGRQRARAVSGAPVGGFALWRRPCR